MELEVKLPKLGESILSATVVKWFKKVGDPIRLDEPLLEVTTDKVASEIPSPFAGFVAKILVAENQEVPVGTPLALISTTASAPCPLKASPAPEKESDFLSPAVMRLLKEKGIPLTDIDQIPRSGNRLSRQDVEAYTPVKKEAAPAGDRVKMTGLRKAIADNMVRSFYEAPHASLIVEVDVTRILKLIQERKEAFLKEHGAKLTITPFIARAIAKAVHAYPLINSSLADGDTIVMKSYVNLGIAVSIDQGVVVPVLRSCQSLTIPDIARQITDLAAKARSNRLAPQDVQEGSITMTNFGMAGALIGIPIIRHPEVAIIGVGAIVKRVVALPDDSIGIRSHLMLSLTFDHRILDGLYGCGFLSEVKKLLEETSSL